MTKEAQRIAMAEVCGVVPKGWFGIIGPDGEDIPDYLNDRNATWAAAEQLGESTIKAMRFWLFTICGEMRAHHAAAAQETEAILRHHGRWVEETPELTTIKELTP